MNIKAVVHEAEEGGFWGEIPALPGCVSQGETVDELMENLREAVRAWFASFEPDDGTRPEQGRIVELAL